MGYMPSEIEIRPARESDIPELTRLVAALAAYEEALDDRARYDWDEIRDAPNWLRAVLNRDHHAVWVAAHPDGHLVGHLWVRLYRRHQGGVPPLSGYISQGYFDEAWRGKGLMKPMLEEAFEWFRAHDVTAITLSVLHRNWLGATAWHRLGFSDFREERRLDLKPRR
ncbi:MAG TPA: GNAT family N-acetyltransferase, partial [Candidatus Binataceae bacterium]|nr:GNAT family N-acetyltransferase [Candidatus Binataceae bacterium]